MAVSAVLQAFGGYMSENLSFPAGILEVVNFLVSFAVITLLFALIFKFVPDAKVAWNNVWVGAAMTALLFMLGKSLLGLYLGQGSFGSAYGAAGSLVVLVVWTYYSAQILYFGAEFTQVYSKAGDPATRRTAFDA